MYKLTGKDINGKTIIDWAIDKNEANRKKRAYGKAGIAMSVVKVSG